MDPVLEPVVEVGVDVAVVGRRQGVAAREDPLDRPARRRRAARRLGGLVVRRRLVCGSLRIHCRDSVMPGSGWIVWFPPKFSPRNAGTRRDGAGVLGQVDQEVHPRAVRLVGERDRDLAADGGAAQGLLVFRADPKRGPDRLGRLRHLAVHLGLEEPQQLGPALLDPQVGRRDLPAVGHRQRVGQRVRADLDFVVDWPPALLGAGRRAGIASDERGCDRDDRAAVPADRVRVAFMVIQSLGLEDVVRSVAAATRRAICFIISRWEIPIQQ